MKFSEKRQATKAAKEASKAKTPAPKRGIVHRPMPQKDETRLQKIGGSVVTSFGLTRSA